MSPTDALTWFKSSYSSDEGDQCLEVAVAWWKSSHSDASAAACVEVAACAHTVHVRDSKLTNGPVLDLTPAAWATLTEWTAR
ncbi:DUF397 domain-containing protein [Streptomyces sp. ZAF1911]|uniref:DUF397 domain-containing protein n=1 Tax=Streptomyces sp. ZAF1911 TaxID=2944129 RepID=UPI00237C4208|nr:DUF397 domain-containing protein [Streptomyces sp. ZAF1911]MDD9378044.1 DUF397 domain-containing protein [Streptomyces sp. ZAF1911]